MGSKAMSPKRSPTDQVTVRWAETRDLEAIRRVAQRDSKRAPEGPTLVAEVGGVVLAARALEGGETIADPFRPTRDLVDMLELRTVQLTAGGQEKGRGVTALWLARRLLAGRSDGAAQPGLAER